MVYEFSNSDANLIKTVGFRLTTQGIVLIVAGLAGILYSLLNFSDGDTTVIMIFLIQSIVEIIIGFSLITVPSYFQRVAETEGKDIDELIGGLTKMSGAFRIVWITLTINLLLDVVLIGVSGG